MPQENSAENFAFFDMSVLSLTEKLADSCADNQPLILIYSQEADTRFLFRTLLEMWNYRVTEAANFEDSVYVAESKKPHLVLMDMTISFIENLTMMQLLRERKTFSETPFILLSGHSQTKFRQMALALGANDFLVKPVDFDLLKVSLKKNIKNDAVLREIL